MKYIQYIAAITLVIIFLTNRTTAQQINHTFDIFGNIKTEDNLVAKDGDEKGAFTLSDTVKLTCGGLCNGEIKIYFLSGNPTYPITLKLFHPDSCPSVSPTSIPCQIGVVNSLSEFPFKFDSVCGSNKAYSVKATDNTQPVNSATTINNIAVVGSSPMDILPENVDFIDPFCYGESTGSILINSVSYAAYPIDYKWNRSIADAGTTPEFDTIPLLNASAGNYWVTITDYNRCRDSFNLALTQPDSLIITGTTPGSRCDAGTVVLSATANGTSINWYSAATGGTLQSGSGSPWTTPSIAVTTTYWAEVINGICTSAVRTPVIATITPTPTVTASNDGPKCAGTTLGLFSNPTGMTYSWEGSNGFVSALQNPTITSVTTPASGVYNVTVTNASCTATATTTVVINPILPVSISISSVIPNDTICAGTSVTFNTTINNGGTAPTYQWKKGPTTILGATGASYTSSALANGDVITCVLTSNTPCATSFIATSNAITMNVITTPSLTASIQPPICSGSATNIVLTPIPSSAVCSWTVVQSGVTGATASSGNLIAQILTYTALPGTATYTITATANVCSSIPLNVVVIVKPTPVATVTSNVTPICSNTTTNIVLSSSLPLTTFNWTVVSTAGISGATSPGTGTPIIQTLTYTGTTSGTATYTIIPTSNLCLGNSITATVTVNPSLPVSVVINPTPNDTICAGTIVTFNADPVNPGAAPTYKWVFNSVDVVGVTGPAYTPAIALTTGNTIKCILTSNALCATGSPDTSNTITMTVNPNLPVSVTITPDPLGAICQGDTVVFIAVPTNGGTNPTYQWTVGGQIQSDSTSNTFTSSTLANGTTVFCNLLSSLTCVTGNNAQSNTITMIVNPSNAVSVIISQSTPTTTICAGTSVTFIATPTNSGTTPVYQWFLGGIGVGTNSNQYTNAALVNGNVIKCILTSNALCATGNPATSNIITMAVNPVPTILTTTPDNNCGSGSDTLYATASAGIISWYATLIGGTALDTGTQFITPNISITTIYYVSTTANECTSTPRIPVNATINTMPNILPPTPGNRCGTGTVVLSGAVDLGTLSWYSTATNGIPVIGGIPSPAQNTLTFTTPSISTTTTYYVEATQGSCINPTRVPVVATINPIPTITNTTPASRCDAGTLTLGATASSGTVNWYAVASGGTTPIGIGNSFTTPFINATTTYYAEAVTATCTTLVRTPITATIVVITTSETHSNPNSCSAPCNGSITITANGGTLPYWYFFIPNDSINLNHNDTLCGGSYNVYVKDINGCSSVPLSVTLVTPTGPTLDSTTATNIKCNGQSTGSLTITASGGALPYGFMIDGIPPLNPGNPHTFNGLAEGTHAVTVKDANNCTIIKNFTFIPPPLLTANICDSAMSCGSIPSLVAGTTFIPDDQSMEYTTKITHNVFNLGQTITSALDIESICLNIEHSYIGDLHVSIECPNHQTALLFNGNPASIPDEYLGTPLGGINHGDFDNLPLLDPSVNLPGTGANYCFDPSVVSTNLIINTGTSGDNTIPPGTYAPEGSFATNLIGCPLNGDWIIHVNDDEGADNGYIFSWQLNFKSSLFPDNYCNGFATVCANGGTPNYIYSWNYNNDTTLTIDSLCARWYQVIVTDANNCTATDSVQITDVDLTTIITHCDENCFGDSIGWAKATASGSSGFTYLWHHAGWVTDSTTQTITNLTAGLYYVTVTAIGSNGCSDTAIVNITEPAKLVASITPTTILLNCFGDDTTITVNVAGGTLPYSYNRGLGAQASNSFLGLTSGTYTITVIDAHGCSDTAIVHINDPAKLIASITQATQNLTCFGNTASVNVSVIGGTLAYQYNIGLGNQTSNIFNNLAGSPAGTNYTVTVTDNKGCTDTAKVTIFTPADIVITENHINVMPCSYSNNGIIAASGSGGTSPYEYCLSTVPLCNTNGLFNGLALGTYTLTLTDATHICNKSKTITITAPNAINITPPTQNNILDCAGGNSGSISLIALGGNGTLSYIINTTNVLPNDTVQNLGNFSGLFAGTYLIIVKDTANCSDTTNAITITEPTPITLIITHSTFACDMDTMTVTVAASGGTGPYLYNIPGFPNTNGIFYGLMAGTSYTVSVFDAMGCQKDSIFSFNHILFNASATNIINPSCHDSLNGSVTISVANGIIPINYAWPTPPGLGNDSIANNLGGGTYTVTVTDGTLCNDEVTFTIIPPDALVNTLDIENSMCNQSIGSITATTTGGTEGYNYDWSNSPTLHTNINPSLSAATYNVTVTDINGCYLVDMAIISNSNTATLSFDNIVDNTCFGELMGQVDVFVTGGIGPFTYLWNTIPAQTTATATNLSCGTHVVSVFDVGNSNCVSIASVDINCPPQITLVIDSAYNATCNGICDGKLVYLASGGVPPYTYIINTTTPDTSYSGTFTGLCADTLTLTIVDANGCHVSFTPDTIFSPASVVIDSIIVQDITCHGFQNDTITIIAHGGTPPLTYDLGNGIPTNQTGIFSGLPANTYTVTVTDILGCSVSGNPDTITDPDTLTVSAITTFSHCDSDDGTVTAIPIGGSLPYLSYSWTPNLGIGPIISLLNAGTYEVTVMDSHGCIDSTKVIVTDASAGIINFSNIENNKCNYDSIGQIDVTMLGGTSPFSYIWNTNPAQTNSSVINLPNGNYCVTVTDFNNCSSIDCINIISLPAIDLTLSKRDPKCFNENTGYIIASATGGTGTIEYSFDGGVFGSVSIFDTLTAGSYTVIAQDDSTCQNTQVVTLVDPAQIITSTAVLNSHCTLADGRIQVSVISGGEGNLNYLWHYIPSIDSTSAIIFNVSAGIYFVTVTDTNSCTAIDTAYVNDLNAGIITFTNVEHNKCFNDCNGKATAIITGGTSPYTYLWFTNPNQPDSNAVNLCAGTHWVQITDSAGCISSKSIDISQPSQIQLSIDQLNNVTCYGLDNGSISVSAIGGTGSYQFSDGIGAYQSSVIFTQLAPAIYHLSVMDENNCIINKDTIITQPDSISLIQNSTPINCHNDNDGTISVSASGGTPLFHYTLYGFNFDTSGNYTNLSAGTYTLTITDANGCEKLSDIFTFTNPFALSNTTTVVHPNTCVSTTGSATVIETGGTSPYSYLWETFPTQTNATATSLGNGNYWVTITDNHSCLDSAIVHLQSPDAGIVTAYALTHNNCFDSMNGSAVDSITGGTPPYNTIWDNLSIIDTAYNLSGGIHSVTVTDALGCISTDTVMIERPEQLDANLSHTNVTCYNDANGTIDFILTFGGIASYQYSIGGSYDTISNFNSLAAGIYPIKIKDANNCERILSSITITQPTEILISSTQTNVTCNNGNNGSITITATNGTAPPYEYSIDGIIFSGNNTFVNLSVGSYSVTVTDLNNCAKISNTITITQPPPIVLDAVTMSSHCGQEDGTASAVVASGGTVPFIYSWDSTASYQSSQTILNMLAGCYGVTVTDSLFCTTSTIACISDSGAGTISFTSTDDSCHGGNTAFATATMIGGQQPFIYTWNNGDTTITADSLNAGIHSVQVKDFAGCITSDTVMISEPTAITISMNNITDVSCFGGNNGAINVIASGGTGTLSYSLTGVIYTASGNFTGLSAGTDTVYVKDNNGCIKISPPIPVSEPSVLTINNIGTTMPNCSQNDGIISIIPSGGTIPYHYIWDIGSQNSQIDSLGVGTYCVTISDTHNCDTTTCIELVNPEAGVIDISVITNVLCFGDSTGIVIGDIFGGTSPYFWAWDNLDLDFIADSLSAGTHNVTVTDGHSCKSLGSVDITVPPIITISASVTTPIFCFGDAATITAIASGGTNTFTYSIDGGLFQQTDVFNGLAPQIHQVIALDANNCKDSISVNLIAPPPITYVDTFINISCNNANDASISITASGGVGPYLYTLSSGTPQVSGLFTNLSQGTYYVTITDANACSKVAGPYDVVNPAVIVLSTTTTNAGCGLSDGTATLTASGGTAPLNIKWCPEAGSSTDSFVSNLPAGSYPVTVTDSHGCIDSTFATISNTNTCPIVFTNIQPVQCYGQANGQAKAILSGACTAASYLWSNGENTETATALPCGISSVIITDINGCISANTVDVPCPDSIKIVANTQNISCFGEHDGKIQLSVTGGTAQYTYSFDCGENYSASWDFINLDTGTYCIKVLDSHNCLATKPNIHLTQPPALTFSTIDVTAATCYDKCDGTINISATGGLEPYQYTEYGFIFIPSGNFNNLCAGPHTFTVSDMNGCTKTSQAIDITKPTAITTVMVIDSSTCGQADGKITVFPSGGSPDYTFLWDSNTGGSQNSTVSDLHSGSYCVTISDNHGCSTDTCAALSDSASAVISFQLNHNLCYGGSIGSAVADVTGGTPPYIYYYNPLTPDTLIPSINGLIAGSYSLSVTDNANCSSVKNFSITEPTEILISSDSTHNTKCYNDSTGLLAVSATNGTSNYTYSLNSDNNITGIFDLLPSGNYIVTVTDANLCTKTSPVIIIDQPDEIQVSVQTTNSTCGQSNGTATINVNLGAVIPWTYLWAANTNNQVTQTATHLTFGTYSFTVTDANQCTVSSFANISDFGGPIAGFTNVKNPNCYGMCDGTVSAIAEGGTGQYQYVWSNNQATQDLTNLCAGIYTITVTDESNCHDVKSIELIQPDTLLATTVLTHILCHGDSTGTIKLTTSGGTPGYQYSLDCVNWGINDSLTHLQATNYTVCIKDAHNCSITKSPLTIIQPPAITLSVETIQPHCTLFDGSITVTPSGGVSGFSANPVIWIGNGTSFNRDALLAGTYFITVTDANSCNLESIINLSDSSAGIISFIDIVNNRCFGDSLGSATAVITGGTSPYQSTWFQVSQNSFSKDLLPAGNHTVAIDDSVGCHSETSVTIEQPAKIIMGLTITEPTFCFGNTGEITASAVGGTGVFTYHIGDWFEPSGIFSGLAPNTYTVTALDSNNCSASSDTTLTAPSPITYTDIFTNITCHNMDNGIVNITASGGTPQYLYTISNGTPQSSGLFSGLSEGNYFITITDSNGCEKVAGPYNVVNPSLLTLNASATDATCNISNGTISINATGGTIPYSYSFNGGIFGPATNFTGLFAGAYNVVVKDFNECKDSILVAISNISTCPVVFTNILSSTCYGTADGKATAILTGTCIAVNYLWDNGVSTSTNSILMSGDHSVTITDNSNCPYIASVHIPGPDSLHIDITSNNVSCNAANDGFISFSVTGGTPPYLYSANTGASPVYLPTPNFTTLVAGTYNIFVEDTNDCIKSSNDVVITQPAALTFTPPVVDSIRCHGKCTGAINTSVNGGLAPYQFSLDGFNFNPSGDFYNLCAGTYTVKVKDMSDCSNTLNVLITQPSPLIVTFDFDSSSCGNKDGTISVAASGGTPGYTFMWDSAGHYSHTSIINGIQSGNYHVTVTDQLNCTLDTIASLSDSGSVHISLAIENNYCFGNTTGSVMASVSGSIPIMDVFWSNGEMDTLYIDSLQAGLYSVSIQNSLNCYATKNFSITQPTEIQLALTGTQNPHCYSNSNGSLTVTATGGAFGYTYIINTNPPDTQGTGNFTALPGGNYTVTITDANSCTKVTPAIILAQPIQMIVSSQTQSSSCHNNNGSATALVDFGGIFPVTYKWDAAANDQTTQTAINLVSGTYSFTVTDATGCTAIDSASVSDSDGPSIAFANVFNPVCSSTCMGEATAIVPGGILPNNIVWSNGDIGILADSLCSGVHYNVTVTDNNLCQSIDSITLVSPNPLTATAIVTDNLCFNDTTGKIKIIASGGISPYQYSYCGDPFILLDSIEGLTGGLCTVIVKDANGCTLTINPVISPPTDISIDIESFRPFCGQSNGFIIVTPSGGTPGYTYQWKDTLEIEIGTSNSLTNITAGVYTITVKDNHKCLYTEDIELTNPDAGTITFINVLNNKCYGDTFGEATAVIIGGTSPYNYSWPSDNHIDSIAYNLAEGIHTVNVIDNNNCFSSNTISIVAPTQITLTADITQPILCASNTGTITAQASGGTNTFTYYLDELLQTSNIFNTLLPSTYLIKVKDANSCRDSITVNLIAPPPLTFVDTLTNITCHNLNNAMIDVIALGGVSPYKYSIITGNQFDTGLFTSLSDGTYYLTITDFNNCSDTAGPYIITSPLEISIIDNSTNSTCLDTNGVAKIILSGGTPPYSIQWDTNAYSSIIDTVFPLPAGFYNVFVTDSNHCLKTGTATISDIGACPILFTGITGIKCYGETSGHAAGELSGTCIESTYLWGNGETANPAIHLPGGNTHLEITDNIGCKTVSFVNIPDKDSIKINIISQDVTCNGLLDGFISFDVQGGSPLFKYNIGNGFVPTYNFTSLGAGTYPISVIDSNNCTQTAQSVVISQPSALNFSNPEITDIKCFGEPTGAISISVNGGESPYNITIDGLYFYPNNYVFNSLSAGSYTIKVKDNNGCRDTSNAIQIIQPAPISVTMEIDSSTCGQHDGKISITAYGGIPGIINGYSYLWSPSANNSQNSTVTNLSAGNYLVTVTDSLLCTTDTIASLSDSASANISFVLTHNTCYGYAAGTAIAVVTGGTPEYIYNWSGGIANPPNVDGYLSAGSYSLNVTDQAVPSCSSNKSFTITEPTEIQISNNGSVDVNCYHSDDGIISVNATGGTGTTYSYTLILGTDTSTQNFGNFDSLSAGSYLVIVKDSNSCQKTTPIITLSEPSQIVVSSQTDSSSCNQNDGNASIYVISGGVYPISYQWDIPAGGDSTQAAINLSSEVYWFTVTDVNHCPAVDSATVNDKGGPILGFTNISYPECHGYSTGTATVIISGGTAPFNPIVWSTGINGITAVNLHAPGGTVTVTDAKGCDAFKTVEIIEPDTITIQTNITDATCFGYTNGSIQIIANGGTQVYTYSDHDDDYSPNNTISNLTASSYTVWVKDSNNCTVSLNPVVVSQSPEIILTTLVNTSTCGITDGQAIVIATGGTPNYSYQWENSHGVSVGTDNDTLTGVRGGSYGITVTDQKGCPTTAIVNINDNTAATLSITPKNDVTCFGGSNGFANADMAGGTLPYHFIWSNGDTTQIADNLPAGPIFVEITDSMNCVISASDSITQPDEINITSTVTGIKCHGDTTGNILVSASGGTSGYSYLLGQYSNNTGTFSSMVVGNYFATVTDGNGCPKISDTIKIVEPPLLSANVTSANTACLLSLGSATTNPTGGTGVYEIHWSNGSVSATISNLAANIYTVTITDANICTTSASAYITNTDAATITFNPVTDNVCFGDSLGSATAITTGGVAPFQYIWENGVTTLTANNLGAGDYWFKATDTIGCISIDTVTIGQPEKIQHTFTKITDTKCFQSADGAIKAVIIGGTVPYTCVLTDTYLSSDTIFISNLSAGSYTITVTDLNNCKQILQPITVNEPDDIVLTGSMESSTCTHADGAAVVDASGGTPNPNYSYIWNNGQTTPIAINLKADAYIVTVTDFNNCKDSLQVLVSDDGSANITFNPVKQNNCFGDSTGKITAIVTGGHPNYTYLWSNGDITLITDSLKIGNYVLTVTDAASCKSLKDTTIIQPTEIVVALVNKIPVRCAGGTTGGIVLSASGGTPSYSYSINNIDFNVNNSILDLTASLYKVYVRDANNCIKMLDSIKVTQPDSIKIQLTVIEPSCSYGTIDGSITSSTTGGTSPYNYLWSTGSTTSFLNLLGNGTYLVTVTDHNDCKSIATKTLLGTTVVDVKAGNDTTLCEGFEFKLRGSGAINYKWTPSTYLSSDDVSEPSLTPDNNITYTLTGTIGLCSDTDKVVITVKHVVQIDAGNDVKLLVGESTYLNASHGEAGTSYSWFPTTGLSDPFITNPEVKPDKTSEYIITATSPNGCVSKDSVKIIVIPKIQFTDAISPNGDGINDEWKLRYFEFYTDIQVSIYNRWGELLFFNKGCTEFWNGKYKGKELPTGTYYYVIVVEEPAGQSVVTGPISIIR